MATLYIFGKISNDISATDSEMKLLRLSPLEKGGWGWCKLGWSERKVPSPVQISIFSGGDGAGGLTGPNPSLE